MNKRFKYYTPTPAELRAKGILDAYNIPRDHNVTAQAPPRAPEIIEAIIRDVQLANAEADDT